MKQNKIKNAPRQSLIWESDIIGVLLNKNCKNKKFLCGGVLGGQMF